MLWLCVEEGTDSNSQSQNTTGEFRKTGGWRFSLDKLDNVHVDGFMHSDTRIISIKLQIIWMLHSQISRWNSEMKDILEELMLNETCFSCFQTGDQCLSTTGTGANCALPMRMRNPSLVLEEGSWGISRLQFCTGSMSVCDSILSRATFSEAAETHPPLISGHGLFLISAAAFWGFSRGGFPENACIGWAVSERNFWEICRRKSPQNTENTKQSSAQRFLNDPLPKDPFFQLLIIGKR